eukprot:m.615484 g.615484  ORF g.615484 m.615484 type:complete len:78 (-) comp22505_c0_seq14:762-995(-)
MHQRSLWLARYSTCTNAVYLTVSISHTASIGSGAPRAQFINPGEREGSLSAVMAKSLGHSTLGRRKVIVSPDAAHGC